MREEVEFYEDEFGFKRTRKINYKEFFDDVKDVLLQLNMDSDEMIQIIRNLINQKNELKYFCPRCKKYFKKYGIFTRPRKWLKRLFWIRCPSCGKLQTKKFRKS